MFSKIKFSPKGFLDFFGKKIFDVANSQNHKLELNGYKYKASKLPKEFDGFRIVQLSDMHNCVYGREAEDLIKKVRINKPDIIVITGDSFDSKRRQYFDSLDIIKNLTALAPVYFITGNHEELSPDLKSVFLSESEKYGVKVLSFETAEVKKGNAAVFISGVPDLMFSAKETGLIQKALDKELECDELELMKGTFVEKFRSFSAEIPNGFNILLSHRPELFDLYAESGFDLIFCGHAHGGQFRIPPVGAIYSPGQGFFPKISEGVHFLENSSMIVSRGLGNSSFPLRINNRPQIIVAELHR